MYIWKVYAILFEVLGERRVVVVVVVLGEVFGGKFSYVRRVCEGWFGGFDKLVSMVVGRLYSLIFLVIGLGYWYRVVGF